MSAPTPDEIQALLNGPGLKPPDGEDVNLTDPPNQFTTMIVVYTIYLALCTIAIAIRMYTKIFIIKKVNSEDYMSFLGWLMFVPFVAMDANAFQYGVGTHQWDVKLSNVFVTLKYLYLLEIVYGPILFIIKLSILLQYERIFVPDRKKNGLHIAIQTIIWVIAIFYTVETLVLVFGCNPREMVWNKLITTGHCIDYNGVFLAAGIFNLVSDFVILLLPQPAIWRLQMPLATKIGISITFAIGLLACLISCLRLYYTVNVIRNTTADATYALASFGFAAIAEMAVGIICGCVPVLPRFFKTFTPKIYSVLRIHSSGTPMGNGSGSKRTKDTWGNGCKGTRGSAAKRHPEEGFAREHHSLEHLRAPQNTLRGLDDDMKRGGYGGNNIVRTTRIDVQR